jgi:hypothetical protein
MTQDEIIRFAIQCRLVTTGNRDGLYMDALTEFANLVAAKAFQDGYEKGTAAFNEAVSLEREACANLIEEYPEWVGINAKREIANAIRARGNA